MALSFRFLLLSPLLLLLLHASLSDAETNQTFHPKALILPVTKDASTLQYLTTISQRTPLVNVTVVVDLGGQSLWVDRKGYNSSSYTPVHCHSAQCFLAKSTGCNHHTCTVIAHNTVNHTAAKAQLGHDLVSIQSTDGSNPGEVVNVSHFLLARAPEFLLKDLATTAEGMAGLGRTDISLPSQFAAAFNFSNIFAICLSSSTSSSFPGVLFFGDGPYHFLGGIPGGFNATNYLSYTELYINHVSTGLAAEYFIGVTSITVNGYAVTLNSTWMLTEISTVHPYTLMETSIYDAVTEAFIKAAVSRNISQVGAVSPFEVCFNSSTVGVTRVGWAVPEIELVLQNATVYWPIFGSNSMVQVNDDVLCLGILDGGSKPRTSSIVIGGYQLEDNLLQFDLVDSKLGFTGYLPFYETNCADFNFTSSA